MSNILDHKIERFHPKVFFKMTIHCEHSNHPLYLHTYVHIYIHYDTHRDATGRTPSIPCIPILFTHTFQLTETHAVDLSLYSCTYVVTEDFKLLTPSVVIRAGQRKSNVVRVRIVDNDVVEDVETFMLAVNIPKRAARNGASYGEPRMVAVTVEDNDSELVTEAIVHSLVTFAALEHAQMLLKHPIAK